MRVLVELLPGLWEGSVSTLGYFLLTLGLSLPLSIGVVLLRLSHNDVLQMTIQGYIYLMQGTPLMLQLVFVYFGLPYLGISLSREVAALVAFVLNYTAYFAEILRGGIQSLDDGQMEACKVLGFSRWYSYRRIVLPQVMKNTLPSFGNELLTLLKDTALISVLGLTDVLKIGRGAANTYASTWPFFIVGGIYLGLSAVIRCLLKRGEKRYSYYA